MTQHTVHTADEGVRRSFRGEVPRVGEVIRLSPVVGEPGSKDYRVKAVSWSLSGRQSVARVLVELVAE